MQTLESISFLNHKDSIDLPIYCPSNDIVTIFPIQMCGQPKLTLPLRKKGQGHPRAMIYTYFVELHCLMLHAKFQNHRPSGSGEDF